MKHQAMVLITWLLLSPLPLFAGQADVVGAEDIREVSVRAHDSVRGLGGAAVTIRLP